MSDETKVIPNDFNNQPMFSVFTIKDGKPKEKPIVSMGIKKAQAIVEHIEELKEYVEENS